MNIESIGLAVALSTIITACWSIPLILFNYLGIRFYKINNNKKIPMLISRLGHNSSYIEDDNPRGWIFGKYYIGYISQKECNNNLNGKAISIWILCTKKFYYNINDTNYISPSNISNKKTDDEEPEKEPIKSIKVYERRGNFSWLEYNNRELNVEKYNSRPEQQKIIDDIIIHYQINKSIVTIIWGQAGSGKSMIPLLLAKQLNGSFCDSYNPTEPGDDITIIYNTVMPTPDKPLILVLEEFDIMITRVHNNNIKSHDNIPVQMHDKTSWNSLYDRIDRGFYPNLILVLTSNSDPKIIDDLDPAYIRDGRVNLRYHL